MIEVAVFDNIYDKNPKPFNYKGWGQFVELLERLSTMPGFKPNKGDQAEVWAKSSKLISPAVYHDTTTRANENVRAWAGWCALDVDEVAVSVDDVRSQLDEMDYKYVMYSTASCTKESPKFRIIFALDQYIPSDKIKHFWFAVNKLVLNIVDAQTKDLSRMFYVPGVYPGAWNFIHTGGSKELDVTKLLSETPYVEAQKGIFEGLTDELKIQLLKHKQSSLTNRNITWNGYNDCPFVSKKLIREYQSLTGTGWYAKLYSIMVSIARRAISSKYPITVDEIVELVREIDRDNGRWYKYRNLHTEALRALEYALASTD